MINVIVTINKRHNHVSTVMALNCVVEMLDHTYRHKTPRIYVNYHPEIF